MSPDRSRSDLRLVRPGDDYDPNQRSAFDRSALTGLVDAAFDDDAQPPTTFHPVSVPERTTAREQVLLTSESLKMLHGFMGQAFNAFGTPLDNVASLAQGTGYPSWARRADLLTPSEQLRDENLRLAIANWIEYLGQFPLCTFISEADGVLLVTPQDADLDSNESGAHQVNGMREAVGLKERILDLEKEISSVLESKLFNTERANEYAKQLVDIFLLSFHYSMRRALVDSEVAYHFDRDASPYVAMDTLYKVLSPSWAAVFAEIEKSMNETPVEEPGALERTRLSLIAFFKEALEMFKTI